MEEARLAKVLGLMSVSSRSLHSLCLNTSRWYLRTHNAAHAHQTQSLNRGQTPKSKSGGINHAIKESNQGIRDPQRLGVGGEDGEADVQHSMYLEHPLEFGGYGCSCTPGRQSPAVAKKFLPSPHHGAPDVLEDLRKELKSRPPGSEGEPSKRARVLSGEEIGGPVPVPEDTYRHGRRGSYRQRLGSAEQEETATATRREVAMATGLCS